MSAINRRRFLTRAGAAVSAPFLLPSRVWAQGPSKRVAHAAIGCNGQAASDLDALVASNRLDVVAVADVDKRNHASAKERFPNARIYQDWRELFEVEGDRIDSCNISIPDHMHAAVAMTALARKKHVYCQKPLTRTIHEARALQLAAAKAGVVTQMGNQIHSSSEYRTAAKMVADGVIGKVKEVHCWSGARFPQEVRPEGAQPVPEGLNWDQWLGVAPERPYQDNIYHPFNWRGWQDFGGGAIGDFGCHIMDTPFKALGLKKAVSIECTEAEQAWLDTPARFKDSWPAWEKFRYEFEGTPLTAGPTMPLYWYDGGKKPGGAVAELFEGRELPGNGALFIGETASLFIVHYGARPQLLPFTKNREKRFEMVPGSPGEHYTQFVLACLGEAKTTDSFEYASPLAEVTLLGTVAARFPKEKLVYNSDALTFTNPEATARVKSTYRKGWEVAGL